ncbi:MAG TPA: hypothetical protein VFK13_05055 [Gemmatimonadaceae bacterium]|nr:hypothetical protein [Gemmatimonadaceae bacterium]
MLTPVQLRELVRELASTKVLSVYHDARVTNPAMRGAWRPALGSALRAVRAGLTNAAERIEFDRAMGFLNQPLPPLDRVWGAPGWVAFLTADGARYAAELPVRVPTLTVWRDGPFVSPYVRSLKQHRSAIVVLVDSRSARFYHYAWGRLTALPEATLFAGQEGAADVAISDDRRGHSYPAPRAAVSTEEAQRRRTAAFDRLLISLCDTLMELAGRDSWIVIGGTRTWAHRAGEALPPQLARRAVTWDPLDHDAREADIVRSAEDAVRTLRARHAGLLLDRLLEYAGASGRGAAGIRSTVRALHARAVDQLLLSPEFLRLHPEDAEQAVRAALIQGAEVEVLSGEAAERLDDTSDGIAARLRFRLGGAATMDHVMQEQGTVSTYGTQEA